MTFIALAVPFCVNVSFPPLSVTAPLLVISMVASLSAANVPASVTSVTPALSVPPETAVRLFPVAVIVPEVAFVRASPTVAYFPVTLPSPSVTFA